MKKIKKDNSGFTLVELLIAIAIIAIVLTPLYSNFRQSTYLNGKAKKAMDATNMASNIMEGLSAYTPEEIILGFYSNDSLSGNAIAERHNTLNIMPNEVTVTGYGDATFDGTNFAKGFKTFENGTYTTDYSTAQYAQELVTPVPQPSMEYLKLKESSNGKYYFYAEGVTQARGTYDIIIALDASEETGFSGDINGNGKIESATETVGYNDYESAQITNINPLFDGVYTEGASQRQNAAAAFLSRKTNASKNISEEDLYKQMARRLTVNVVKDPSTGLVTITVDEEYEIISNYFNTDSGVSVDFANDFSGASTTYSLPTTTVFDGNVYKQAPREIYIYYIGNYSSVMGRYLDGFYINNDDHVPVNIHLMRIKTSETTNALEANYRSRLEINEAGSVTASDFGTVLYSNLRDNITLTAEQNATNREDYSRCMTYINGTWVPNASSSYADVCASVIHENGGVRTDVEDRIYSVKMYVYEEGAAASGFQAEDLITEFDGSSMQ